VAIVDIHVVLDTESCIVTGELGFWGDVRKNGKNKLVWESEDYENVIE